MGYMLYEDDHGRQAGYAVDATCDYPGCDEEISRNSEARCEHCVMFFCWEHKTCYDEHDVEMDEQCTHDFDPKVPNEVTINYTEM
jgi:hypothetical protein